MKFTIFWIVYYGIVGLSRSFKIQRPSSGGDLPQFRRVNSNTLTMFMDNDVEGGNLGPYADRPRVFPSMRSKVHTPLVNTIQYKKKLVMGLNLYLHLFFFCVNWSHCQINIWSLVAKRMCFSWGVRFMYAFDS